ncbi:MAG: hypothetical protein RL095_2310 [Verrucomicrobiota bacterium]|jgi:uncharacterized protein YbaR (Trm112 family)
MKTPPPLAAELLELLACPRCPTRPPLRPDAACLVCDQCASRWPLLRVDGPDGAGLSIPDLFQSEADHALS